MISILELSGTENWEETLNDAWKENYPAGDFRFNWETILRDVTSLDAMVLEKISRMDVFRGSITPAEEDMPIRANAGHTRLPPQVQKSGSSLV